MNHKIGITAWGSVSALGISREAVQAAYRTDRSFLQIDASLGDWTGRLPETTVPRGSLATRPRFLDQIDRSVLLTLLAVDQFWEKLAWSQEIPIGINIGSSRGATGLWEHYFREYADGEGLSPLSSPTTTLGNISSWLGAYLQVDGPSISHSVTCSSGLQSLLNAVAWLESGRCRYFLAGGSEAPLTDFTVAQMKALRIYAHPEPTEFPCRSLDPEARTNTMVLGEGAAVFALETEPQAPLAWIAGMGSAQEVPTSPTSVSKDAGALQRAMRQALREAELETVDAVICHAPGTRKGDAAEVTAVRSVFGGREPFLTGNKWKLGHSLGASGALSLEMALLMLQEDTAYTIPYMQPDSAPPDSIRTIMINAMGFGGNAVSVIIRR
ncbi:beta-ketoacyl synthase N-terminal-like domain-containing protein [Flavilitoribacter nigricans]|uniref:Beta-ketoacyl synthase n=1 Tax=Flavilitoribacter nigricans (strain ATCC 23147 / DSM 23189 / NBRC 102662 / NCIMB 1420 / SS-2) TaxID=1122177 RepID=A0A2D0N409_FLAN2|nr:beta-ketoacyl synthase N-terminal-like domain-containing protein [Flavilitoribacter nigricans]PHN02879.1 beta-ketoacyl synthase [Flavilitoribacter nigricans DSM 23189 = NBRC 102662]